MSHRHSFNTQPRKRIRQMHAKERWEDRIKKCAEAINGEDNEQINVWWGLRATTAHEQRDILKSKLGY